jgi:hypothetical protein
MAETKKAKAPAKPRKPAAKKSAAPKTAASTNGIHLTPAQQPSYEQVAELARKYWAERGYKDGHHEEDWFRAEQELRSKAS